MNEIIQFCQPIIPATGSGLHYFEPFSYGTSGEPGQDVQDSQQIQSSLVLL